MFKNSGRAMHNDKRDFMLHQARNEAKADAAVSFSSYLDKLATYADINHLSNAEIIELLRQESEKLNNQSREYQYGVSL